MANLTARKAEQSENRRENTMTSRLRIRSKEEKRLIDAGHALLDDPKATPADKLRAMGYLERAIRLAEKRRIRREDTDWYPEPSVPKEPTVDDLVSALESKKPLRDAPPCALQPFLAPPSDSPALEGHPNRARARRACNMSFMHRQG